MASSPPPPASEPKKQPSADVAPSGVAHPSADETSAATELEAATAASAPEVETPGGEENLSNEKTIPSTKALMNGAPFSPSGPPPPTGLKGATPSGVETTQSVAQQPSLRSTWTEVRSFRYFLGVPDSHGAMLFMVLVTVPYALLTAWLVRRVADGQPTSFVWTIAILATSYFFIGAIRFTVTLGFQAIFIRISYVALLSVAATHFIGPTSGTAVATLLTFYAARIFGHTIAEYIHRAESEAMVDTPPSGCRKDQKQQSGCKGDHKLQSVSEVEEDQEEQSVGKVEEDQKEKSGSKEDHKLQSWRKEDQRQQQSGCKEDQLQEPVMCFLFVHGVMSLFVLMRMVWVVLIPGSVMFAVATEDDHATEALMVVNELSLEMLYLAWPWATFVAIILQEEIVITVKTMLFKVGAYIAALYTLSVVLSIALGEAYGLLVLWPTTMAMVGLYGYIVGMFARYDHICASLSQVQQPMEQKVIDEPEARVIEAAHGAKGN